MTGSGWLVRAEPGAPSPPDALCRDAPNADAASVIVPSPDYADLTDSVSLLPLGGGGNGLILRAQDARNYYLVAADAATGRISIQVERNGTLHVLASARAALQTNTWQELSAQIRGSTLTAFLNGRRIIDVSDSSFARGSIGLWSARGAGACFDNLMATGL